MSLCVCVCALVYNLNQKSKREKKKEPKIFQNRNSVALRKIDKNINNNFQN